MRLFLDASVSPALAAELTQAGFDVIAQRDALHLGSSDLDVMAAAWAEQRIVVARDYDMAELVLRGFAQALGVVIVAFDSASPADEAKRIASELQQLGETVPGSVVVIELTRVRQRPFDVAG